MAPAFTLAVAEMHPAAPSRMPARRKLSLPTKTSKPAPAKASSMVLVLPKSPELSFIPTTVRGWARRRRSTSFAEKPTCAIGGKW